MNSGESYISSDENWYDDEPQSKASRVGRWIFGLIGITIIAAILLYLSLAAGAAVCLGFIYVLGVSLQPIALTLGGLAFVAGLLISAQFVIEIWHPIHNWIRNRMDVLVID